MTHDPSYMNNHHVSLGGCLTINPKKTRKVPQTTSKSRLAVDREFMYIGSAGPGPGGRAEGRADGRAGGRGDFERQYNDVHRFFTKIIEKHYVFLSFRIRRSRAYRFLLQK